jgi:hypothetical protein
MMRFTAFQLNPGMRDIGDYRSAKPTHCIAITHVQGIYLGVDATEHTHSQRLSLDISPVIPLPPEPPKHLQPPELSEPAISLVPGFNRVSRKVEKRI